MPLIPGQQLFEYRIERVLGEGAFGIVYLAHDTSLERPVAIKVLNMRARSNDVAFKRFLQEARAAGKLNNPHIVTVYALREHESDTCQVMEYLEGGNVRSLLESQGRLPVEQAVSIAADVCEGLAAAHARGIVHRDIKAENVLLTGDGRAKVGDFGIAHVPRGASGAYLRPLTDKDFQPGTLLYMSPEQVRGQAVDGRSDVYQVGELLYEMLTGQHYIDLEALDSQARAKAGSNVGEHRVRFYELLAKAICEWPPASVRDVRPEVPERVAELLSAAMAEDATDRPTAAELAVALRGDKALQDGAAARIAEAHLHRAGKYADEDRWDEAVREIKAAVRIDPDNPAAHRSLGSIYESQGRWDEAITEYQAALRINPDDALAHRSLGSAYGKQGRLDEAIQEYQAALRIQPRDARTHRDLGGAYSAGNRLDEAIDEYRAALRIEPHDAATHRDLGHAYSARECWDEAIKEYEAALRFEPHDAWAHLALGKAHAVQERWDVAIKEHQAALRIDPEIGWVHISLARVYAEQGNSDEAIKEYLTAQRIRRRDVLMYPRLVHAGVQERWDQAIRDFQAALRMSPDDARVPEALRRAYAQDGHPDEAVAVSPARHLPQRRFLQLVIGGATRWTARSRCAFRQGSSCTGTRRSTALCRSTGLT